MYLSSGPSHVWHMDGYDKLKPYGMAIHGCIDGYSRKLMWLKVRVLFPVVLHDVTFYLQHRLLYIIQASYSNNDPKIVAQYFVQCVKECGHSPKLLRTDCGTENGLSAGIQALFHDSDTAHAYGKSTSNQRIEALWSKLRPAVLGWIEYFKDLIEEDLFHPGVVIEVHAMRRAFMSLINDTLTEFVTYWNCHRVRKSSDSPGGVPDVLFYTHNNAGATVSDVKIAEATAACDVPLTITGDNDMDEYLAYVMEESQLQEPRDKLEAFNLYQALCQAVEQRS